VLDTAMKIDHTTFQIQVESPVKLVHIQFTQTLCQLTKWVSDASYITNYPTKIWQKSSSETMFHSTALITSIRYAVNTGTWKFQAPGITI